MSNGLIELKNQWRIARSESTHKIDMNQLIQLADAAKMAGKRFQWANSLVLISTIIGLCLFFRFLAPLETTLSHFGIALMIGSLTVRVLFEVFSLRQASKIDLSDTSIQHINASVAYLQLRKRIHGPITYSAIALYTIGLFVLNPEFSKYWSIGWLVSFNLFYLAMGFILTRAIRKKILGELRELSELLRLREELVELTN